MKLNERTLIQFSISAKSPPDKEGWLFKRGEVNKSFQQRYFVLKGNLLYYFEKRLDKEPAGLIILEGCTIELAEEEQEKFAFKIVFPGAGKRTYVLGTESWDTLNSWMKTLCTASYDYMKVMVNELQQQLNELEEQERLAELNSSKAEESSKAAAPEVDLLGLNDTNSSSSPRPPPRTSSKNVQQGFTKSNPFNQETTLERSVRLTAKKTWASMHKEYGVKILADRSRWVQARA